MKATKLALLSLPVLFLLTLTLGAVAVGCSSEAVVSSEATVAPGTDVQPTTTTPSPFTTTGRPRYIGAQPGETRLENRNMAGLGYLL